MATLVFTVIGMALGGPIGGAIGALAGQALDAQIFKPKGRTGPRLADLDVQTSRYGAQVPRIFGRMRVAGTVIWATDLRESSSTSKRRQGPAEPDELQLFGEFRGGALVAADRGHRPHLGRRQSAARRSGRLQGAAGRVPGP